MPNTIRIGCGAGFSGDRLEPAVVLAEQGALDYLVLECLAERTIALAQKRKRLTPGHGYDPLLERRLGLLLPSLVNNKVRLITNMGAANPLAAGQKIITLARELNLDLTVAVVTGDDVLNLITGEEPALETGLPIRSAGPLVSANAYLGIDALLPALAAGAQVIITGRVADPSLFLAPMVHEFGWSADDYSRLGQGTVIGHLLECAGQLTGGYFADPLSKPVRDMDILGHPFADISPDGTAIFGKVYGTGGQLSLMSAKEQLLYEVMDPARYMTPDVIADFTGVFLTEAGPNLIQATGGTGVQRPDTLKVSVGYDAGYIGEGELSYAGPAAEQRAILAGNIIRKRIGHHFEDLRVDYIGSTAAHHTSFGKSAPYEIRLRVAGRTTSRDLAALIGEEVEALYTNGPAGGGGARKYIHEVVGMVSTLLNRQQVHPQLTLLTTA